MTNATTVQLLWDTLGDQPFRPEQGSLWPEIVQVSIADARVS